MRAILLSLLLMFGGYSYAEDSTSIVKTDSSKKSDFLSSDDIGVSIGMVGGVALLSTRPKIMGGVLLAASLITIGFTIDSHEPSEIVAGFGMASGIASWGLYNINKLDKDNYSHGEVFLRNMAIPIGAFAITESANWLLKKSKPDTKANINITPLADGAVLSLSSRF